MKLLKIKTTKAGFFIKYLLVINEMLGLRRSALDVFARILYWNDFYKDLPTEEKNIVVFNSITRKKILDSLHMSRASLDNQFTYLRKKSLILGTRVNPKYEIFYDTHKELTFSFELDED